MSREAWGDPPEVDVREPCDADRPPERTEDGTPICPWCEQPVWDHCRSQYDTMTCVWRPLEGDDA